jgi:succinate dehydrogenase hydrophobic anchor subunit
MRTVTMDYLKGGKRIWLPVHPSIWSAVVLAMGTIVVFTVTMPGA